ncbi:MAG: DUF294 nucleotidyltransferase-like domain-containing protein [Nocardioides sp.]|uniref:DUF294 nucleotidyltransferase-like domain-containing protein n=1 Tax=Nocardioides sp. TaxID=35761 RepID=UPI0039E4703A
MGQDLAAFLRTAPPLSSLPPEQLDEAAARASVETYQAGDLILDAYNAPVKSVFVVLDGYAELWNRPDIDDPDEVVGPGGIFGFSAMLTGRTIGPRAVARGQVRLARIPAGAVRGAFASPEGAAYLADRIAEAGRRQRSTQAEGAIIRSPLGGRLLGAVTLADLRWQALKVPDVLAELTAQGLAPGKVIAFYSASVDTVVRRTLELVFADHPELPLDRFTWLCLGSNGRREAVLSSDIDAAVVFRDDVDEAEVDRYREVFAEVSTALAAGGIVVDTHGTMPTNPLFARTATRWEAAARHWLADPVENNGAMMTSLLIDGRPLSPDRGRPTVARVFSGVREHRLTLRLLLQESLAKRARTRSVRDLLGPRSATFDIKDDALLPIVNLARWAALATGSPALSTTDRLTDAAGSSILPKARARTLAEVFEVLQGIRLRYQLDQHRRGERATDVLLLTRLSPIDHSIINRAVREIAAAQKRADNVSNYLPTEQWTLPEEGR